MGEYHSGAPTPQRPPAPNVSFFRNTMRPDWMLSGDVWGEAFEAFMGAQSPNQVRALVLPEGAQVIDLGPKAPLRCRYCKSIVHGDKCQTCGAPQ